MMMDKGEFVKKPIEITPAMNGGYIVRGVTGPYSGAVVGDALAFTNYRDLLAWLNEDYAAANVGPQNSNLVCD